MIVKLTYVCETNAGPRPNRETLQGCANYKRQVIRLDHYHTSQVVRVHHAIIRHPLDTDW